MKTSHRKNGFTLIELLVVIAIIAVLSSIVISSLSTARSKARDSSRVAQIRQIQTQLDMYFDANGVYPNPSSSDCAGWNTGNATYANFITSLSPWKTPRDMGSYSCDGGLFYYRYAAGSNGCPAVKGAYYVIAFRDTPTVRTISLKSSFGLKDGCTRDWNTEYDWVTGKFENDK